MIADTQALRSKLDEVIDGYEYKMFRKPHLHPLASMLSKTLYGKRFFPFYTFNLLAGITPEGEPRVYGYDAIGSYDYQRYGVQGSGQQLMVGLLDNQFQRRFGLCQSTTRKKSTYPPRPKRSPPSSSTRSSPLPKETSTPVIPSRSSSSETESNLNSRASRSEVTK
jgi:hypothetical protein